MGEFDVDTFTNELRQEMYIRFPYEWEAYHSEKHKYTPEHIRDVAFMNNPVSINLDMRSFDIGGYMAESKYPYYHILQDAPVIRKRNKGTLATAGSQGKIYKENKGLRDYSRVSFNGKTYSREYSKNVRGKRRKVIENSSYWKHMGDTGLKEEDRGWKFQLEQAKQYVNIHYKYIDKILDNVVPILANRFGGRMLRKVDTGLKEEFDFQTQQDLDERFMIEDMLSSYLD